MIKGISVIICCYNSALRIGETLRHLALQKVSEDLPWEVIVVDNASTDDTAAIAQLEWNKYQVNCVKFKVVSEAKPGRINALIKGVDESIFEYLITCDDDNWLNYDYVERLYYNFSFHHCAGIVGGRSEAIVDGNLPKWFGDLQHRFAIGIQANKTGFLENKLYLWGAGMGIRRSLFKKIYECVPALLAGRSGDQLIGGEDVEICARVLLANYGLYYDEYLLFKHYLPANRLSKSYKKRIENVNPQETKIIDIYYKQIQINKMSKLQKIKLLFLTIIRLNSNFFWNYKWNKYYEREVLFLLTGFSTTELSTECKLIRKLNLLLINQSNFASLQI